MIKSSDLRNVRPSGVSPYEVLVEYYGANGPGFGSVDILFFGSKRTDERIGLLLRALLATHFKTDPQISRFLIVLLPANEDDAIAEDQLRIAEILSGGSEVSGGSKEPLPRDDR